MLQGMVVITSERIWWSESLWWDLHACWSYEG